MYAGAEGDVAARLAAVQVDLLRAFELPLVAVAGGVADVQHGAGGNGDAVQLDVLGGGAEQALHRPLQAQHLLDEGAQVLVRVRLQRSPDLRVLDQQLDAEADGVGGGLGAADEGVRHHLRVQLVVVQGPTPFGNHPVDQLGEQGVVRRLAQPFEDGLEVVLRLDLHLHRPFLLRFGLHHAEALHPGVGPGLDLPDVLLRHAHLLADDDQRQGHGELLHPVAAAVRDEGVQQLVGGGFHEGVHLLDLLRAEGLVEHGPHLLVVGVVPPGQGGGRQPALVLVELLHSLGPLRVDAPAPTALAVAHAVAVGFGVQQDAAQVLEAGDHIEAGDRVLPHRRFVAQLFVGVVGAVLQIRVQQVDVLQGLRHDGLVGLLCFRCGHIPPFLHVPPFLWRLLVSCAARRLAGLPNQVSQAVPFLMGLLPAVEQIDDDRRVAVQLHIAA